MMTNTVRRLIAVSIGLAIAIIGLALERGAAPMTPAGLGTPTAEAAAPDLLQAPLSFEPNLGQVAEPTRYLSRGPGYALHMDADAARLHLGRPDSDQASVITMRWLGGRAAPALAAVDKLPGTVSYLSGRDQSNWLRDVPTYKKVSYRDVYPGIDLVFYGNPQRLEYDLVVAAGAQPGAIRLQFDGIDRAEVEAATGDLMLRIGERGVRQHAPVAFQEIAGQRVMVPVRYQVADDGAISFALGAFDATQPLVIDPVIDWSTFLGGNHVDYATAVALNTRGDVFIAGGVNSSSWPLAPNQPRRGESDAFISRFRSTGEHQYTVFFGGGGGEIVADIAIDRFDNIYLTGTTTSLDYPTTAGAAMEESASLKLAARVGLPFLKLGELTRDTAPTGDADAFMTKLDGSARNLLYSTYLSGSPELALKLGTKLQRPTQYALAFEFNPGVDQGNAIAVDGNGNAYVAGTTLSDTFPATAKAFKSELNGMFGAADGFITKINTNKTGLQSVEFSSYIGGSCHDEITDVAVDVAGRVYLTGTSDIGLICGGFYTSPGAAHYERLGQQDAFVMKLVLNDTPGAIYSSFIGSGARDFGGRVGFDHDGNAYASFHQELTFGGSDTTLTMVSLSADGKSERWKQEINYTLGNMPGVTGGEVRPHALFTSTDGVSTRMFLIANATDGNTWQYSFPDLNIPIIDSASLNFPAGSKVLSTAANARRLYVAGVTTAETFPVVNAAQPVKGGITDGFVAGYTHAPAATLSAVPSSTLAEGDNREIALIEYARSAELRTTFDVNISWGDGSSEFQRVNAGKSGIISSRHAYRDNGAFKGHVCVSEAEAGDEPEVCEAFTVNVTNVAPTLTITNPTVTGATPGAVFSTNDAGLSLRLATLAAIQDPGGNDTHTATVKWEPLSSTQSVEVARATRNIVDAVYSYGKTPAEMSPVARVCVEDDDGASACAEMTVKLPIADLKIENFGPETVGECSVADYRVKVTNHGPDTAQNVTIRQTLPDPLRMSYLNAITLGGGADGTVTNAQALSVGDGNYNFATGIALEGDSAVITDGDGPYLYKRNPANFKWDRVKKLDTANDGSVAMRGDWLAVAREGYNTNPTTTVAGSVALFKRTNGVWPSAPAQVLGPTGAHKVYATSVAIGDDFLAVGDKSVNGGGGLVHIYRRDNNTWTLDQILEPPAPPPGITSLEFGAAVALSPNGRLLAVGAPSQGAITGSDGSRKPIKGVVLIYSRDTGAWMLEQQIVPSNAGLNRPQRFGYSIALNEDSSETLLAVGAPDDPGLSGGLQTFAGRAFLFKRSMNSWSEVASFTPSDAAPDAHFGRAVDISGNRILVGTGQPMLVASPPVASRDRAYLFGYHGGSVNQLLRLRPAAVQTLDGFGMTLALSGADMIVGAPRGDLGKAYAFSSCGQPWGPDSLECNVGSLAPDQSAEFLVSVRVGKGIISWSPKQVAFLASAFGGGLDPDGATASAFTIVNAPCTSNVSDITPPAILPKVTGGIPGKNGWYLGGDVKVEWTVTDAESATVAQNGCTAETVSLDTNGTTFTCTASSAGGSSSNSVTIKRDSRPPIITASVAADEGYRVKFVCEDPVSNGASSGFQLGCPMDMFPGPGGIASRVAEDLAGHKTPIEVSIPLANASLDQRVTATNGCVGNVTLNGSGSVAGAAPFSFSWRKNGEPIASGITPTVSLASGTHDIDLVVTNAGGISHTDRVVVTVVDDLPPVLTNVPAAITVDATGHHTPVSLGLPVVSDACTVTLTSSAPEEGFLAGVTTVMFRATDSYGNETTAATTVTVTPKVNVGATLAPLAIAVGSQDALKVTLTNQGPSRATDITIVPDLPDGVTAVKVATDAERCIDNGDGAPVCTPISTYTQDAVCIEGEDGLACVMPGLDAGETRTFTLTVAVSDNAPGPAPVSFVVTPSQFDTDASDNRATGSITLIRSTDLSVSLTAPASGVAGRAVTYTASVLNAGPASSLGSSVTFTKTGHTAGTLPANCVDQPAAISCAIGALAAGASTAVSVSLNIDPSRTDALTTTATVGSADTDSNPANNSALAQVAITTESDLLITMTAAPDLVKAGQNLTYSIVVTNNGPSDATAIEIAQALPADVALEAANGCAPTAGSITCVIPRLAPGAAATQSVVTKVAASARGTLTSTVDVSGAEIDPDPGSNHFVLATAVQSGSDLQVTVTARPAALVPGQTFVYAIEIVNAGPATATGLHLTHRLPPGIASGALPDGCTLAAGVISCDIEALDLDASETIELLATPAVAGSHTAVSSLTSESEETDASNNTALTVILAGSPSAGPVAAGDFDGDGDLDLAIADEREDQVQIYSNRNGKLVMTDRVRVGRRPEALAVGDLDDDGDLDIATVNRHSSSVSIVENNGHGDFREAARPDLRGNYPVAVVIGDFTGDGQLDIVAALRDSDGLALLTRGSDGRWGEQNADPRRRSHLRWCRILERPSAMAAGDFDGDGDLDLVMIERSGRSIGILANDGRGRFTDGDEIPVHRSRQHDDVAVGDFDGDGDLDLAVTGLSHNRVTLIINEGQGQLRARTTTTEVGRRPEAIAAGDFDGDGKLDLATANRNEGSVSVLRNVNGAFPSGNVSEIDTLRQPIAVLTGDFNGDGKLDIMVVSERGYVPQLILNR